MSIQRRAGALLVLVSLGVCTATWFALSLPYSPQPTQIVEIPDRFVELVLEKPTPVPVAVKTTRPEEPAPAPEKGQSVLLKNGSSHNQIADHSGETIVSDAESAGILGVLGQQEADEVFGDANLGRGVANGVGGLIGTEGVQIGSGGMGTRGSGIGGGGTAEGLGGLGTKGRGSGNAGYGAGSGLFPSHPANTTTPNQRAAKKKAAVTAAIGSRSPAPAPARALERREKIAALARAGEAQAAQEAKNSTEHYTDYGINEVVLTETDNLSTFSIDVDTASYTIARSKLNSRQLPPRSSVRVEEFVNYFKYDYPPPTRGEDAPFSINMEAAPSPWTPNRHILRVGIQGQVVDPARRPPARLTFLVDVSGSMNARNKLPLAQDAMMEMVDNLGPKDSVAIATYAGRTERVLAPTSARNKDKIKQAIQQLRSGGGTNMDSGIEMAYQMANDAFVEGAENRVVILSDGDANVGRTSYEALLTAITDHARRGITLSTIGFGRGNYKDTLMEQLANKGDGNYFYIDTQAEALKVFNTDLTGMLRTIARDVKIQVEFDSRAVMAYRLIGYENRDIADRDFRNDKVDAGEIGSGHQVTALYELVVRENVRNKSTLATVRLRAKPPGRDAPAEEWQTAFPAKDVKYEFAETSRSFRLAVGAATFAEKLRHSPHVAEISYAEIERMVTGTGEPGLVTLISRAASLTPADAVAID